MANNMRWRYGDTNPVVLGASPAAAIEIGDLVYMTGELALPASSLADAGTKAANQEAFHDAFVGVAMQCSPAGSGESIRIATSGVFEFDAAGVAGPVGTLLGPDENTAGTALEAQKVIGVTTPDRAIGRCAKADAGSGRVLVDIVSTVLKGGPQVMA